MEIESYLPSAVLTNEELAAAQGDWTAEGIFAKTGIRVRHIAAADESALDLAEKAARGLFARKGIDPASIDYLLLCTQSAPYRLPSPACLLQDRLGLSTSCGALAFDHGCSGFVYGLSLAKGLLAGGLAKRILLVTAETYSKYLAPDDFSTRALFGDGASATLLTTDDLPRLGAFVFGTDGSGAEQLIVREGRLSMDGPEIFSFALDVVPKALDEVLEANSLTREDISFFVFHQANAFMLGALRVTCGIPREKFVLALEETGNTVSSTIPIALEGLEPGSRVVLIGFGVGLSWAATVVTL